MSFVSKQISRNEAQSLMKKYKIFSSWLGNNETAVANMASTSVYDDDTGAFLPL